MSVNLVFRTQVGIQRTSLCDCIVQHIATFAEACVDKIRSYIIASSLLQYK